MSASALYIGQVMHRRHHPHPHAFRYPIAQLLLDLDELDTVFAGRWLWSVNRRNLAEFRRSDYFGDPARPLADAVRDHAAGTLGYRPAGPVRLLTHLRFAGHVFNPVSFYYCYQADGSTLDCIVAEITNTPGRNGTPMCCRLPRRSTKGRHCVGSSTSTSMSRRSCRWIAATTGASTARTRTCAYTCRSGATGCASLMPPRPCSVMP